jgi:autotransporter-associated beta strand protein
VNHIYRVVWNRAAGAAQVVSESTKASTGDSGKQTGATRADRRRVAATLTATGLAVGVGLGSISPASWAAGCTASDLSACSAPGGSGYPDRSGNGGSGNGAGGGGSAVNGSGVTIQVPGAVSINGAGGAGAQNDSSQSAGGGAAGAVFASGNIGVTMPIQGGTGTGGFDGLNLAGGGGGGGAGAVYSGPSITVSVGTSVVGGQGGAGGDGTSAIVSNGGGGGGGGAGMITTAQAVQLLNQGTLSGGAGGNGGGGGFTGGGGGGGDGLVAIGPQASIINAGTITGGVGGAAGGTGSTAGGGGVGVNLVGVGSTLANLGTISGADGIDGAAAGIGILSNGGSIANSGTISGGLSSDGVTRAAAIRFDGTANFLNLLTGSSLIGSLAVSSGADATIAALNPGLTLDNAITLADSTAKVAFNSGSANLVVSGIVAGAGAVSVGGSGTITLTGTNTYTGGTTIQSGTLALSGAGSIAASSGLVNNGIFDISATTAGATLQRLSGNGAVLLGNRTLALANANGTFAGSIDGSGGLTLTGGTQSLAGTNTYTGATTIQAGTLAMTGAGRLSSATTVALTGNGATLDLSAGTSQTVAHLSGVAGSQVALGANTLTLSDNTSQTFLGSLTGNGSLIKQGTGTLTLNGASPAFAGTTAVAGGTLAVGDAANPGAWLGGSVQVGSLGTLRGHGTIGQNLANDGVVAPGGSIGTLTVGGNYAQAPSGTLVIEVSPTDGSQLRVGGTATLNGTLSVVYAPGTYAARRYTVLTAANGISGRFSSVTASTAGANLGALGSTLVYDANQVDLSLQAADSITPTDPSAPVVIAPTLTTIYTAMGTSTLLQGQRSTRMLMDRLDQSGDTPATGRGVWAMAGGSGTKVSGTDGAPGFMTHAYGFLAGVERQVGQATIGAAAGYTYASLGERGTGASGTTDTLRLALYGRQSLGPVYVSGTVGYGLDFLSQKRPFAGVGTAEGDRIGHEFTSAAQVNLPLAASQFTVTPYAGLRFAYFHAQGFSESGANGQNLTVGTDNARSVQPYVGMKLDKQLGSEIRPINAQLRLGYAWETIGSARLMQVQSADATVFAAPGTGLPRALLSAGIGVSSRIGKSTEIAVDGDGIFNTGDVSAFAFYARIRHVF